MNQLQEGAALAAFKEQVQLPVQGGGWQNVCQRLQLGKQPPEPAEEALHLHTQ